MRRRIRGPAMAGSIVSIGAAATAAWLLHDPTVVPFLFALPILLGALLLTWQEELVSVVLGLLAFLGVLSIDGGDETYLWVVALAAVCAVALLLAARHRDAPGVRYALPRFTPAAGMLGHVATDLAASLDPHHLLGSAAQQLTAAVGVSRCVILMLEDGHLRMAASTGLMPTPGGVRGHRGGHVMPWERVRELREPLVLTPSTEGVDAEALAQIDALACLVLPLLANDELLGVAVLDEPGHAAVFDDERIGVGQAVAGFTAVMINNARLFESQSRLAAELRERSAVTETLVRMGNEVRTTYDLDEVIDKIGRSVVTALEYREVAIYLYDEAADTFVARLALGGLDESNAQLMAQPLPRTAFDEYLRPEHRIGNSYFKKGSGGGELGEPYPFWATDLGPRPDNQWQTGDALFVPLYSRGRLLGILDVYDPEDRALPTLDSIRSLEVFANQAAIAIDSALQYEELRVQERRLERQLQTQRDLLRVSESILATLDEKVVFETIGDKLNLLVEFDTLAISKVDWQARRIDTVYARDEFADELMANPISIEQGLWGWAVTHDEPMLCNECHLDPRAAQVPGTPVEPQASIVLPLRVMNKVIGVLNLDRLGGKTFSDEEFELVKPFANLAAIAIENASLYEKSQLRAITDPLTGLYHHGHFQETLEHEVRRCERYGDRFSLLMMDLDHFKLVNDNFGHPRGDQVLRRVAEILRESTREADYVARYGGEEFALLLPKTTSDDARQLAERIRVQVREIDVAPGSDFRVSASIGVADFPACGLDAKTMLGAADSALMWAKHQGRDCVLYYRDARQTMAPPLAEALHEAPWRPGLEVLAAAVDAKASFREHHSEAVAQMVRELAEAAGFDATERDTFELAARFHDVGKIGISPEILERDETLTDDERAELQRHVAVGTDILRNAETPRELAEIVGHHHERWDGSGYPDGLRRDEIPLGARLVAICDAFQAMLSDRPYRSAYSLEEARRQIAEGAGGQFDPALARLFLDRCPVSGAGVQPVPSDSGTATGMAADGAAPAPSDVAGSVSEEPGAQV